MIAARKHRWTVRGTKLNLSFGTEVIYEDAEFNINAQDKVGIVGVNGSGKTTLFRVLLGEQELDSGSINIGSARMGYLPQEITLETEDVTAIEYLQEGRPIRKLEAELDRIYKELEANDDRTASLLRQMTKIQAQLEYFECYDAEDILLELIDSMDVDAAILNMKMAELSGGQKSKLAFLRLLYSKSEILLLDEPTNHLDATTKDFIIDYLKKYKGSVLIISHDVEFLNQVINKVMYINKVTHKILMYDGDYTAYQKKYAEQQRVKELLISRQDKELKDLAAFVLKAKQASRTNHALKAMGLERQQQLEKKTKERVLQERRYKRVKMNLTPKREGARTPLEVIDLTFGYPEKPLLYEDLSFKIEGKERFLVVGENGVGKSTLLKLIIGALTPKSGRIRFNPKTDIAYYAQELEQLDLEKNVLQNVETEGYTEWQLRAILGNFLFYNDDVYKRARILSPGEKARVALCKLLLAKANLLILDEPTNHLDPETQAIIGGNFKEFEGTIILVSHNPMFAEQIGINRMLVLPYGKIEDYSVELLEYLEELNTANDKL